MKDYYDIWLLLQQFDFDGANLVRAIDATFRRRRAVLPTELPIGLSIEFVSDAGKLSQWDAFLRRSRLDTKEINLEAVVKVISDFMIPPSIAAAEGKAFSLEMDHRWTLASAMTTLCFQYRLAAPSRSRAMKQSKIQALASRSKQQPKS